MRPRARSRCAVHRHRHVRAEADDGERGLQGHEYGRRAVPERHATVHGWWLRSVHRDFKVRCVFDIRIGRILISSPVYNAASPIKSVPAGAAISDFEDKILLQRYTENGNMPPAGLV